VHLDKHSRDLAHVKLDRSPPRSKLAEPQALGSRSAGRALVINLPGRTCDSGLTEALGTLVVVFSDA
jgi:hypothetical protein